MKDPELAVDQSKQSQQQACTGQTSYTTFPYQTPVLAAGTAAAQPFTNHQLQQQQQQLQVFWENQMREIEHAMDFKNHSLPLARIKKIMKADEDVRMISAEAPVIFAKACEIFILELTLRSWLHTEENKRRTLQKNDIAAAISRTDVFDFLVDIIPRDELREEARPAAIPFMGSQGDTVPYYYMPQQHPGLELGKTSEESAMYSGQQLHPQTLPYMPWPPQQPVQQPQTDS